MFNPAGGLSQRLTILVWSAYVVAGFLIGILGIAALVLYNEKGHGHPLRFIILPKYDYAGFQPHATPIIIMFCFLVIAAFFLAVTLLLRGSVITIENYYEGLFRGLSKFAPIPLFLFIAMILIPICDNSQSSNEDEVILTMIFSITTVVLLFIIYYKSNLGHKIYGFVIKKFLYSGILVLSFFFFWNSIIQETAICQGKAYNNKGGTLKGLSIVFQIIFSVCVGLFAFHFADIVAGVFGIFIEIAVLARMTKFKTDKDLPYRRYNGDCAISGMAFIFLTAVTILTIVKRRDKILR